MRARFAILLAALLLAACAAPPPASNASTLEHQCTGFGYVQGAGDFANCLHMLDVLSGHS